VLPNGKHIIEFHVAKFSLQEKNEFVEVPKNLPYRCRFENNFVGLPK